MRTRPISKNYLTRSKLKTQFHLRKKERSVKVHYSSIRKPFQQHILGRISTEFWIAYW